MKWTTSIKIIVGIFLVVLISGLYHFFKDDTVVVEDYKNVTDLRNTFNADTEIKAAMYKLSDKELKSAKVLSRDDSGENKIALTFDGLPREHTLARLLDLLAKYDVSATFFVEGGNAAASKKSIELIEAKQQAIGNYTFVGLSKLEQQSLEEIVAQLCSTQKVLSVVCNDEPELFKAPRTEYNHDLLRTAGACGLKAAVQTDVYVPVNKIIDVESAEAFLENLEKGSIVSFVTSRPVETLRYKEKTGGGNPANDKAPSIKLGAKAKTKYENIVDVVERLLIACKQNGIKIVSVKDMKLEESGTFLARYYEPESETLEYADGFVYKSKKYGRSKSVSAKHTEKTYEAFRESNNGILAKEHKMILTTEQAVAFSFVGFNNPTSTYAVLDRLNKLKAHGTFFVNANDIKNNDVIIRRILDDGHELGIATYSMKSGNFDTVCQEIEETRKLLLSKYQVDTDLVKQPWGKIEDYTKEAVAAMSCRLVSHNVDVVQTRHKAYQGAHDVLSEIFGKFIHSVGRGWIINFRMDYYDNPYLCADVMQLLKERKIDNIAYWSFYDDPDLNVANDSVYKIKSIGSIINNKKYVYELTGKVPKPELEFAYNSVKEMSFKNYILERYIGTQNVNIDSNTLGFTQQEARYLDVSGILHTNRPVVFFTFDDWGTDAAINQLLYVLRKHKVKCTFFMLTRNIKSNPNLLRAIAMDGHEIASHTNAHPPMVVHKDNSHLYSPISYDERLEDYKESYRELVRLVGDVVVDGRPALTRTFRAPTLTVSKEGFKALHEAGFEYIVSGSDSSHDYEVKDLYELIDNLRKGLYKHNKVKKGAIFVMHMSDTSKFTPRALDILLTENAKKSLDDPTRFETGCLRDYLVEGYNQSKRIETLKLQEKYGN